MDKYSLKKILLIGGLFFLTLFLLIVIGQVLTIYSYLANINQIFAFIVTAIILSFLFGFLLFFIIGVLRYPKIKEPPVQGSDEYEEFLDKRLYKLKKNKYLKSIEYEFEGETTIDKLTNAYAVLKKEGDRIMKKDANGIFLTTAISQNGVLDGLTVLFSLMKTIYRLTVLYENRPNYARLIYLYVNIATVVLIARSIEDMDLIEEQLEPILTSIFGGTIVSAIPGGVTVSSLIVNSIVEGSVNALLSLRVSCIAQRYLVMLEPMTKSKIRKGASLEAAGNLGYIIKDNAVFVAKSITSAAKNVAKSKISSIWKFGTSKENNQ
ncbi:MAG: hypothetical protein CSB16_01650 [Clostridiales bacterium]|nr:MAG: hypothetical protein CSB16_01650 [Clostridiales bacterium]